MDEDRGSQFSTPRPTMPKIDRNKYPFGRTGIFIANLGRSIAYGICSLVALTMFMASLYLFVKMGFHWLKFGVWGKTLVVDVLPWTATIDTTWDGVDVLIHWLSNRGLAGTLLCMSPIIAVLNELFFGD
ncbi:hypothetical protein [Desulfatibacillum alkenivorans]|jgi:hypothetical protein|uniref:hypothetical protein n=1 Tax=Desulfatibacillum alkenivorans TaxID=259354 RepID=UPI001114C39F|nr:hypothetical protein [Desulfatibacillum alkenivorans]